MQGGGAGRGAWVSGDSDTGTCPDREKVVLSPRPRPLLAVCPVAEQPVQFRTTWGARGNPPRGDGSLQRPPLSQGTEGWEPRLDPRDGLHGRAVSSSGRGRAPLGKVCCGTLKMFHEGLTGLICAEGVGA